ncbi:CDC45-like protein [Aulographum hederae CBS 113979]|uniref:CDC45-like protein n=1 Tax=Aulographum hederae CBS 113979 TaxID=1176131 RepID=A0A6G1HGH0_9PEZI|nr:CDC45-like protein [Aulographum hederae CBS 113979]
MYLPRDLIAHLYNHLLKTHHTHSPPVLLLVALEPDALCACRILTSLLRRDYIQHKIQPISGYADLRRVGQEVVRGMRTSEGGSGGIIVCLGVGGLVDLEHELGLEPDEQNPSGIDDLEIWLLDSRRPWHLANVFGGRRPQDGDEENGTVTAEPGVENGRILQSYRPGRGGIIAFDDGDIDAELATERLAYCAIEAMPDLGESDADSDSDSEDEARDDDDEQVPESGQAGRKRKSWSDAAEDSDSEGDEGRPAQRRRSNSSSSIPSSPERPARRGLVTTGTRHRGSSEVSRSDSIERGSSPSVVAAKRSSMRSQRLQLRKEYNKHNAVLKSYYDLGSSYSEPISSLVYSLASELGREDNDLLWQAIVGISSLELSGQTLQGLSLSPLSSNGGSSGWNGDRGERIREAFRDEVRRHNPVDIRDHFDATGTIQTHAKSPTDTAIRLSPEPRFLLIRHWSLYESMLHSPYMSSKLHLWTDQGRKRLHKLLARMGISLSQCKQSYTHMDMDLKRSLREKLLTVAPRYSLEGVVPEPKTKTGERMDGWGFVRCWGWKACLSATDVAVVIGSILEVGQLGSKEISHDVPSTDLPRRADSANDNMEDREASNAIEKEHDATMVARFWTAYDALTSVSLLTSNIATAQYLHRAILRTGTSLLDKKQIRHLSAFRMGVVKEGPDVQLFTHPGALIKLALWLAEAIVEVEGTKPGKRGKGGELVMAGLDEAAGLYTVVGLGGGGGAAAAMKERERRRKERLEEKAKRKEEKKEKKRKRKEADKERRRIAGIDSDDEEGLSEEESDDSESEGDSDDEQTEEQRRRGYGRNMFGLAFQNVARMMDARTSFDSFEHSVIQIKKEDLSGFLEKLSLETVTG